MRWNEGTSYPIQSAHGYWAGIGRGLSNYLSYGDLPTRGFNNPDFFKFAQFREIVRTLRVDIAQTQDHGKFALGPAPAAARTRGGDSPNGAGRGAGPRRS